MKVMAWLFGTGEDFIDNAGLRLPGSITFRDCRALLGAREVVLRTRMMYQFYLDWLVLNSPFPFHVVDLPEVLESELFFAGGLQAVEAGRVAWNWPGVTTDQIISRSRITIDRLVNLESSGLLGWKGDNWYCIGRNPKKLPNSSKIKWRDDTLRNEKRALSNRREIWEGRRLTWAALWPSS